MRAGSTNASRCCLQSSFYNQSTTPVNRNDAVNRSGEYGAQENQFSCSRPEAVNSPPSITLENNGKIRPQRDRENAFTRASGGEKGIRTLETVPRLHTFQACAFDHSAISPLAPTGRTRCARLPTRGSGGRAVDRPSGAAQYTQERRGRKLFAANRCLVPPAMVARCLSRPVAAWHKERGRAGLCRDEGLKRNGRCGSW